MAYTKLLLRNEATPDVTLRTQLRTMMDAHSAWEWIEAVVIGNYTYDVYRSNGASNGHVDFYMFARWFTGTGTGTPMFLLAEQWNTDTKQANHIAPANATRTPDATTGAFNSAVTLDSGLFLQNINVNTDTTYIEYFISLTARRLVMASRTGTTSEGFYLGLFEPFWDGDTHPLVSAELSSLTLAAGAGQFTRNWANRGVSTSNAFATHSNFAFSMLISQFAGLGTEAFYAPKPVGRAVVSTRSDTTGGARGLLYGMVMPYSTSGVVNVGDTITVGGVTHVNVGASYFSTTA